MNRSPSNVYFLLSSSTNENTFELLTQNEMILLICYKFHMKMPRTKTLTREKEISTPANIEIRRNRQNLALTCFSNQIQHIRYFIRNKHPVLCTWQKICSLLVFMFGEKGIKKLEQISHKSENWKGKKDCEEKNSAYTKQKTKDTILFFSSILPGFDFAPVQHWRGLTWRSSSDSAQGVVIFRRNWLGLARLPGRFVRVHAQRRRRLHSRWQDLPVLPWPLTFRGIHFQHASAKFCCKKNKK